MCGTLLFPFVYIPTLILNALLKPEAKNPPKGPITLLKIESEREWNINGYNNIVPGKPN